MTSFAHHTTDHQLFSAQSLEGLKAHGLTSEHISHVANFLRELQEQAAHPSETANESGEPIQFKFPYPMSKDAIERLTREEP
jgi:hypothetical protein